MRRRVADNLLGLVLVCVGLHHAVGEANVTSERGGRLAALSAEALAKLPAELLHLVQAETLSSLPGSALASVVKMHKENAILVGKCVMAATSRPQREEFLKTLKDTTLLPERVQAEIAAYMVHWFRDLEADWKYERFSLALHTGSPLLAYLPREFIYGLDVSNRGKFLYHLRVWSWATSREEEWARKPRGLQRSWAEAMVSARFPPLQELSSHDIALQGFLLTGATPDELSQMKLKYREGREIVLRLHWDPLQARAVFRSAFPRRTSRLLVAPPEQVRPILALLTPAQLQSLDTGRVNLSDVGTTPLTLRYQPSWASARQLAFFLLEQAEKHGRISSAHDAASWGVPGLSYLGRWTHALPTATITKMFSANPRLMDDVVRMQAGEKILRSLDSAPLSCGQARALLGRQLGSEGLSEAATQRLVLQLSGRLLAALPASSVANASVSLMPQRLLVHLLESLPADSPALFPLYLKTWTILNREWVLDAMLSHEDPGRFLRLMGSSDVAPIAGELRTALMRNRPVAALPRSTLSMVLGFWRRERQTQGQEWRGAVLNATSLLPGLRCDELRLLGPESGLPVLAALGQVLRDTRTPFPRDLTHCGLEALLQYLETRMRMQERRLPLLDALEPAEIDAVGGYIFTQLPPSVINSSANWQHIVKAVGRVSMPELLVAFGDKAGDWPGQLAQMALRVEPTTAGLASLELLGNLLQFVPYHEQLASRLEPRAFALWLEGLDDKASTALCVPRVARIGFWNRIIMETYGPSANWSAGTLGSLGGLLVAVLPARLDEVPSAAWTEAADVINADLGYTRNFMQVCARFLGVDEAYELSSVTLTLLRRLVDASNNLSATVRAPKLPADLTAAPPTLLHFGDSLPSGDAFKVLAARNRRSDATASTTELVSPASEAPTPWFEVVTEQASQSTAAPVLGGRERPHVLPVASPEQVAPTPRHANLTDRAQRKLSCGALRMAPLAATLTLNDPDVGALLASGEMEECLEFLGTLELSAVTTATVWRTVREHRLKVPVRELGLLLSQVDLGAVEHADLKDLDTVTALGRYMDNWDQVGQVAELVLDANNVTERLSDELAGALGTLTCGMFALSPELARLLLRPEQFMKVSPLLAGLLSRSPRCPPAACLQGLAAIAAGPLAAGHVDTWSPEDVASLGIIVAGLSPQQTSMLAGDHRGVRGITADAVRCMPTNTLKSLGAVQLGEMTLSALDAIPPRRLETLSEEQRDAIRAALSPPPRLLGHAHSGGDTSEQLEQTPAAPSPASSAPTITTSFSIVVLCIVLFHVY